VKTRRATRGGAASEHSEGDESMKSQASVRDEDLIRTEVTGITEPDGTAGDDADTVDRHDATAEDFPDDGDATATTPKSTARLLRPIRWSGLTVSVVLPVIALFLAGGAGYFKWQDASMRDADTARIEATRVAHDSTIALLSYESDDVDQKLGAARQLLTGQFQDSYTSLINDVVIPGAKRQQIASTAAVPAIAAVSGSAKHVVALAFVDQTITISNGAPTNTASSVRVTLDRVGDRWLISSFEPV
jgi:Mce-associated membrane protein